MKTLLFTLLTMVSLSSQADTSEYTQCNKKAQAQYDRLLVTNGGYHNESNDDIKNHVCASKHKVTVKGTTEALADYINDNEGY